MDYTILNTKISDMNTGISELTLQIQTLQNRVYESEKYQILNEIDDKTWYEYSDFFNQIKSICNDFDNLDEQKDNYEYTLEIRFKNGSLFGYKILQSDDTTHYTIRVNERIMTFNDQFQMLPMDFINDLGFDNRYVDALSLIINKCISEHIHADHNLCKSYKLKHNGF